MSTRRDNRKLVALNKENCEEHPRSNLILNSNLATSQEDYITQVFGEMEIEGRVRNKLSQEFSRTQSRILGALSRLDDFVMNRLSQGHSGTAPEAARYANDTKQGTKKDDSQSDPHPEAGIFQSQTTRNSGPGDGHHMVTSSQVSHVLLPQYVFRKAGKKPLYQSTAILE